MCCIGNLCVASLGASERLTARRMSRCRTHEPSVARRSTLVDRHGQSGRKPPHSEFVLDSGEPRGPRANTPGTPHGAPPHEPLAKKATFPDVAFSLFC